MTALQRPRLVLLVVLAVVASMIACAGDSREANVAVRDSAGIRIVENDTPVWAEDDAWTVDPAPLLQIGVVEGEEAYQFEFVHDAARRTDGVIAVSERRANQIRLFGPDGTHIRTMGRSGEGPGEFGDGPYIVWAASDTLLAWDRRLRRLTWLDDNGSVLREESRADALNRARIEGIVGATGTWQLLPDGALLVRGNVSATRGVDRHPVRFLSAQESLTSFGDYEGREQIYADGWLVSHPFSSSPNVVARQSPFAAFVTGNDRREIMQFDARGELTSILRIGVSRIVITDEMLEAERDQWRGIAERLKRPPSTWLDAFGQLSIPDSLPAIRDLHVDAAGNLWVGRRTAPDRSSPDTFDVLDVEGRWLGTVNIPEGARPIYEIGDDYILTGWLDDLGVPYVRMYRILK